MFDFTDFSSIFEEGTSTFTIVVSSVVLLICLIAQWKVFEKAGERGWKAVIPFYNIFILCRIADGSGIKCLLLLIPLVNVIYAILLGFRLAKAFGKGILFALGLIFFAPVFYLILGYGSAAYIGPQ